jgi:hypothetical protein
MSAGIKIRSGQREFERGVDEHRISAFLTRRQYGKTTEAARIALKKMMRQAGHTVVFGSVKLDLGREIVRKESEQIQKAFKLTAENAKNAEKLLRLADTGASDKSGKREIEKAETISLDDFAELYEAQRLEFRLYHSRSVYSRTKVVALTPDAVGETGDLILDEVGRVKKFREVWEAVKPIIASNPEFRCLLTTTPPPDDTHYSFELLAPPIGRDLPINPKGNWYRSDLGVWVLRVTADDAYADGVMLYDDDTGAAISPEESRRRDPDKDAWDRNYGVKFVIGGSSVCGLMEIDTAQRRGIGQCGFFHVADDMDFDVGLKFLAQHIGEGPVGIGVDWASSQKEGTNPTSVTVSEGDGENEIQRVVLIWKLSNPDLQRERLRRVVQTVNSRPKGGRARKVAQDATGQQLFCRDVAKELYSLVPVESVVMSESVELPAYDTPISKKTYLGDLYVAQLNDNRLTMPPERYIREDHRMPKKIKGLYVCDPASDGKHGDTFDSGKLASWALRRGGVTTAIASQVGTQTAGSL